MWIILQMITPAPAFSEHVIELPILGAMKSNNLGMFEVLLLRWDQQPTPVPTALQWQMGNVVLGHDNLRSMSAAFQFAVERTPSVQHSGTVTAIGIAYMATGSDGPSAGTINPDGTVGPVGSIPDKVRAATREGYRTILIPAGQLRSPDWDLVRLGLELNVDISEVGTIEDAYQRMTGHSL
jgi:hypothetical protein